MGRKRNRRNNNVDEMEVKDSRNEDEEDGWEDLDDINEIKEVFNEAASKIEAKKEEEVKEEPKVETPPEVPPTISTERSENQKLEPVVGKLDIINPVEEKKEDRKVEDEVKDTVTEETTFVDDQIKSYEKTIAKLENDYVNIKDPVARASLKDQISSLRDQVNDLRGKTDVKVVERNDPKNNGKKIIPKVMSRGGIALNDNSIVRMSI